MIPENWLVKQGMFDVPLGCKDIDLISRCEKAVEKFVKHFERLGYRLVARPKVSLLTVRPTSKYLVKQGTGGSTLLVPAPQPNNLTPDHPWVVPDRDQYVVRAWFAQPRKRTVMLELSDRAVQRLGLERQVI